MTVSENSRSPKKMDDPSASGTDEEASNSAKVVAKPEGSASSASAATEIPGGEEPSLALEPDLPSDGKDAVGEAMIRDLPQRPELSEPPSQPNPFPQKN